MSLDARTRLTNQLVASLRRHLAGGKAPVPEAGRMVWGWFVQLSATRSYNFSGPNPISFTEIEAWARLHRLPIEAHHVDLIRALDRAWLDHAYAKNKQAAAPVQVSSQKVTVELFDVMWA